MSVVIEVEPQEVVSVAVLVEAELESGVRRVWSGTDVLRTLDGREWEPVGAFGAVSELERGSALEAPQFSVSLSLSALRPETARRFEDATGVAPAAAFARSVGKALEEDLEGRAVTVWLQWFDPQTGAMLGAPEAEIVGRMSRAQATLRGVTDVALGISAEHEAASILRGVAGWLTPADQRSRHPGDRGCDVTGRLEGRDVIWPKV
jgi:hypothetical protein